MTLTPAQRKALEAVRDRKVKREYRSRGNTFLTPKGVGARAVWALERLNLIRDGEHKATANIISLTMELTDAGQRWLWENPI